jgi:flagellar biosynthesis protein FlhF
MTQTQNTLHMKTYFSPTVEAAVELARRELGSEAMLVNSRPAPEEVRHLGRYEVIFASDAAARAQKTIGRKPPVSSHSSDTQTQLEDIRLQLTTIRQSLSVSGANPEPPGTPSDASFQRRSLEAGGVEAGMARELVHAVVRQNPAPAGRDRFRQALVSQMENRLKVDPAIQAGDSPATVALVGPPGRGKSTTLVKLAVTEGLARRRAVRILSMDNYRIGAGEQMRCFGTILGVSFQACETVAELDRQLANSSGTGPGLTLIDTSGYGPADLDDSAELAGYFSAHPEINMHLVLRADGKTADGITAVQRYSSFGVSRLIFTGIDEAATFGSVYGIAVGSGKPISFLGTGQRIPEDLEPATASRIVRLVLNQKESTVSAAA